MIEIGRFELSGGKQDQKLGFVRRLCLQNEELQEKILFAA